MPVLDHEVHESVKIDSNARYGCFNRKPYTDSYLAHPWAATGHKDTKHRMSRECRFDMSLKDLMCEGCKHRGSGELYNEMIRSQGT